MTAGETVLLTATSGDLAGQSFLFADVGAVVPTRLAACIQFGVDSDLGSFGVNSLI